jgi:hypothetical protein
MPQSLPRGTLSAQLGVRKPPPHGRTRSGRRLRMMERYAHDSSGVLAERTRTMPESRGYADTTVGAVNQSDRHRSGSESEAWAVREAGDTTVSRSD